MTTTPCVWSDPPRGRSVAARNVSPRRRPVDGHFCSREVLAPGASHEGPERDPRGPPARRTSVSPALSPGSRPPGTWCRPALRRTRSLAILEPLLRGPKLLEGPDQVLVRRNLVPAIHQSLEQRAGAWSVWTDQQRVQPDVLPRSVREGPRIVGGQLQGAAVHEKHTAPIGVGP